MTDLKRISIYLGSFIGPLSGNAVLALVPTLKAEFDASAPSVLLSITFFMIPFAFFTLFSGAISDVYDRKKTVLLGFLFYIVGSIFCAVSPNLSFFYLARIIQGFGYGFVNPVLVAILGDIVPYEERGKAMGNLGAATTAGIALGPFIAGFISIVNWRAVFLVIASMIAVIALFFRIQFMNMIFARGTQSALQVIKNLWQGIRDKKIFALSLTGFLTFIGYVSTISFVSDFLSLPPLSLKESDIGAIMATTGIAGVLAAPVGGRLTDKLGRFITPIIGYILIIVSMVLMGSTDTLFMIVVSLAVLGSGTAIVWAPLLTLSVEIKPGSRGTVSSLFNGSRFFGYSLAPIIAAPIYVSSGIEAVYLFTILLAVCASGAVWIVSIIANPSASISR
ncbi:MAG: MFS transporter [Methanomassiliicoccales archaeon]